MDFKFPKTIQDDFVFIFRHKSGMQMVFGTGDAEKYKYKLQDVGYKHTATLSASLWIERLLEKDSETILDMVCNIDT